MERAGGMASDFAVPSGTPEDLFSVMGVLPCFVYLES